MTTTLLKDVAMDLYETAEYIGCSYRHLLDLKNRAVDPLPVHTLSPKVNRCYRSEVDAWIKRQERRRK